MVSRVSSMNRGCSQVSSTNNSPVVRRGRRSAMGNVLENLTEADLTRLCSEGHSQQSPLLRGYSSNEIHTNGVHIHCVNVTNSPRYRNRRNAIGELTGLPESLRTNSAMTTTDDS